MERIRRSGKEITLKIFGYVIIVAFIGAISIATFTTLFETQKEKALQEDIEFLESQLAIIKSDLDTLGYIASDLQKKDDDIYRNIFGAEQYPSHLREGGIGGSDRYKNIRGYDNSDELIYTKQKISTLQRKLIAQSKSLEELYVLAKDKNLKLSSIPAIQPVSNTDLTRIASGFGMRMHPIYAIPKMHTGIDFSASTGTEIYATGDGTIEVLEHKLTGYGTKIIVNHGFGFKTLYAHMSKTNVRQGQKVKRGEVIGYVGSTGTSVAPHLHYEVLKNETKVDPANYFFNDLSREQFEEVLERSQMGNQSFD